MEVEVDVDVELGYFWHASSLRARRRDAIDLRVDPPLPSCPAPPHFKLLGPESSDNEHLRFP